MLKIKRSRKNQITTLLNKIVYTIPKEVVITEIKNTEVKQAPVSVPVKTEDIQPVKALPVPINSGYFVQIGAFSDEDSANEILMVHTVLVHRINRIQMAQPLANVLVLQRQARMMILEILIHIHIWNTNLDKQRKRRKQ